MHEETVKFREKVFDLIFESMISGGGDGDATIACDDWQGTANVFEEWVNKNHPDFLKRINNEGMITFYNNQESIRIVPFKYDENNATKSWVEGYFRTLLF